MAFGDMFRHTDNYLVAGGATPSNEVDLQKMYDEGWRLVSVVLFNGQYIHYFEKIPTLQ